MDAACRLSGRARCGVWHPGWGPPAVWSRDTQVRPVGQHQNSPLADRSSCPISDMRPDNRFHRVMAPSYGRGQP